MTPERLNYIKTEYLEAPDVATNIHATFHIIWELIAALDAAQVGAERWRYFVEHAQDWIDGEQLGEWICIKGVLAYGSRDAAIDATRSQTT